MQVILLRDIDNLGEEGDIVSIKDGYGRNYLIPQGMAQIATEGAIRQRREERKQQARKRAQMKDDAVEMKKQLEESEVLVLAKVGEENRIFGTVTSQQIAVKLAQQGFNIDRRDITIEEDIRVIGVYTAEVKLHSDVTAEIKVRVEPEP